MASFPYADGKILTHAHEHQKRCDLCGQTADNDIKAELDLVLANTCARDRSTNTLEDQVGQVTENENGQNASRL